MQNSNNQPVSHAGRQKPISTHKNRNIILIIVGVLVLFFAYSFIKEVVTIRGQILSGDYNFEEFGSSTSGEGGANVDYQGEYDVATKDDPLLGSNNPKVTIVEFSDFECPFCRQSFPTIRSLVSEFGDTVQYIYRDFPLESIHPNARAAAVAGYCAQKQDKFWQMHDKLFQNQDNLSELDILNYANQVGLNISQFSTCIKSDEAQNEVSQDLVDGANAGALGTPTWFINGNRFAGVIPEDVFREIITEFSN